MAFKCLDCDICFDVLNHLQVHRQTYHNNEMLCFICRKRGFQRYRYHLVRDHPNEIGQLLSMNQTNHEPINAIVAEGNQAITANDSSSVQVTVVENNATECVHDKCDDLEHVIDDVEKQTIRNQSLEVILTKKIMACKEDVLMNDNQIIQIMNVIKETFHKVASCPCPDLMMDEIFGNFTDYNRIKSFYKKQRNAIIPNQLTISGVSLYWVPICDIIRRVINNSQFWSVILTKNQQDIGPSNLISSFRDCHSFQVVRAHSRLDEVDVYMNLSLDDFTYVNPLGPSASKGKLCGVYCNFPDMERGQRSKRKDQHLITLLPRHLIDDNGIRLCLKTIEDEMVTLEKDGLECEVDGVHYLVKLKVHRICGDNKGIFELMGKCQTFVTGKICIVCNATYEDINEDPFATSNSLRTAESWHEEVSKLQSAQMSHDLKTLPSFYNLNSANYHNYFPPDRLHNFILGVYKDFMEQLLFKLFDDSELEVLQVSMGTLSLKNGVPQVGPSVARKMIVKLRGTGAQIYDFFLNFPEVMINLYKGLLANDELVSKLNSKLENPSYQAYLVLRNIDMFVSSSVISKDEMEDLNLLIHSFFIHRLDAGISNPITPKLHRMTHLVHDLLVHGPLNFYDTIVFERRHQDFKSKMATTKSYVNPNRSLVLWDLRKVSLAISDVNNGMTYVSRSRLSSTDINILGVSHHLFNMKVSSVKYQSLSICTNRVHKLKSNDFIFVEYILVNESTNNVAVFGTDMIVSSFDPNLWCFELLKASDTISKHDPTEFCPGSCPRTFIYNDNQYVNKIAQ